jgi:hypothetical protein
LFPLQQGSSIPAFFFPALSPSALSLPGGSQPNLLHLNPKPGKQSWYCQHTYLMPHEVLGM